MQTFSSVLWICVFFSLYFLPWIVAAQRGHINRPAIALANFFFGWTGIGWLVCLIWSTTNQAKG